MILGIRHAELLFHLILIVFLRWTYLAVYMCINDCLRAVFEILVKKTSKNIWM